MSAAEDIRDHEAEAANEEATIATVRGALLATDAAACAVRVATDALRDLHRGCVWYASGSDEECSAVDELARTAWAVLTDLADGYARLAAEYDEEVAA